MLIRLALAAFLLGHAAIHAGYLTSPPTSAGGPAWPFRLDRSRVLRGVGADMRIARVIGVALVTATVAGFTAASLATFGALPEMIWPAATSAGAIASFVLLVLFFHPWLILGVVLDVVLLWSALIAGWSPSQIGA